jgi:integrase
MSVSKRPGSPYYWTEFEYRGRRVRESTKTASRRDAEAYERRRREEVAAEFAAKPKQPPEKQKLQRLTLDVACGRYWIEHGRRRRDARDEQRNLKYITQFIDRDILLTDLSNRHVNELRNARLAMGAGPAGVNRTLTTLQTMHNHAAQRWEVEVKVIAWRKHKLKEPKERVRWITREEAQRLLNRLKEFAPHIEIVVRFMLLTGLRREEAFNCEWAKIEWDKSQIIVRVKGGHERAVDLEAEAMQILREQPKVDRYIFDTTNWRKHFDRGLEEAAIEDFTWHDLRHTFATWLGRSGAPIEVVSKALGHSSIAVTMKYRHVIGSEVRDALRKLPTLQSPQENVVPLKRG